MTHPYTHIVIGGGSAGCVMAARLSQDPAARVLLIEAGARDRSALAEMPMAWRQSFRGRGNEWGYSSEPEPGLAGRRVPALRGKVLGGSGAINGLIYSRGHPGDYDEWAALGATGWDWQGVLPYFRRAETHWRGAGPETGGDGPLTLSRHTPPKGLHDLIARSGAAAGLPPQEDINDGAPEGIGVPDFNIHAGRRGDPFRRYLRPALRRGNLTVVTGALCNRILFDGTKATGAEYLRGGEAVTAHASAEVVLCAGAFASPAILMRSGVGDPEALRALGIAPLIARPEVGRGLQDHQAFNLNFDIDPALGIDRALRLDRMTREVLRWGVTGRGMVAQVPVAAMGFLKTAPDMARPDIQLVFGQGSLASRLWMPGWRAPAGDHLSIQTVLLRPEARGSVTLRSARAEDAPRLSFGILDGPGGRADLAALTRAFRRVIELTRTAPLAGAIRAPREAAAGLTGEDEIEAFLREGALGTAMHPVGTCAIGRVVDLEGRVIGAQGLRVADASLMPRVPGGNTNAPTIMIAEKIADAIRRAS